MEKFKKQFIPQNEKTEEIKGSEKKKPDFEVMKTPEIVIQEERGAQLFSLLLKAKSPEWGETETLLAKETVEYFKENPLDPNILKIIHELQNRGVDEEAFYNMALIYKHPKRIEGLLKMAKEHKSHIKNPQKIYQEVLTILESIDKSFSSSPLAEKFIILIEKDKNNRIAKIEETRKRIEKIIAFFKPDSKTTTMQRLIFVPTDPLYKKNSGRAFSGFFDEHIIISHIDNIDNQDHEFCHGIINPIVKKLSKQLTEEQKEKVSQLTSGRLKQDYGDGFYSLLCEEFIRTYNDYFKKGRGLETYDNFQKKLETIDENQFQKEWFKSDTLTLRFQELGVKTLLDFKNKSKEYFEKFEKDQLQNIVFKLYQEYANRPDKEYENFEKFILEKFPKKI